jgi:peptidyl-prolyl cis-trans isomerase A (cyclophilin A)
MNKFSARRTLLLPGLSLLGLSALGLQAQEAPPIENPEEYVCLDTNVGEFCVELFEDTAPLTVANFLGYVESGEYDKTIIHRSMPRFVIQGGGYYYSEEDKKLNAIPKNAPVVNEFRRSNVRGTMAMAKLGDNPNSATNEWFISLADNSENLDNQNGGFTVFGQVIGQGMAVVDAIAGKPIRNFTSLYGGAFDTVPVIRIDSEIDADDFVTIKRMYLTDENNLPEDPDLPVTTGVFTGSTLTLPVQFRGTLLRMIFDITSTPPEYKFRLRTGQIIALNDVGQERAEFDLATGVMTVPSVLYGLDVMTDLVLKMSDPSIFAMNLESFNLIPAPADEPAEEVAQTEEAVTAANAG